MEPDLLAARTTPCPSCGASLRPDAPWCTLCYADLRPAAVLPREPSAPITAAPTHERPTEPPDLPLPAHAPDEPQSVATPGPLGDTRWPCSRCQSDNPMQSNTCAACGAGFLAAVRDAEPPLLLIPGVGDLTKMDRGKRLALAVGLVAAVLVPLAVSTALLTGSPRTAPPTVGPPAPVAQVSTSP